MKRLLFRKKNLLEWEEIPEPKLTSPNEAIIRPIAVSRCDLDLAIIRGSTLFRPPFPIGHEFIGEIDHVSEDLSDQFPKGTRVILPFQISCGQCQPCKFNDSKNCDQMNRHPSDFGMGHTAKEFGGALSEKIKIPFASHMLFPIEKDLNPIAIASISDNIAEAWKMVGMHLEDSSEKKVLVLGGKASSIGLYSALLGVAMGAEVYYSDSDSQRLKIAEECGAKIIEANTLPKSFGKFDIVADAYGTEDGFYCAMRSVAPFGTMSTASVFWTNSFSIPFLEIYNYGIKIVIGRVNSHEWIPKVLSIIRSGKFPIEKVVTRIANWKDAKEAMMEETTKLVITHD